MKQDLFFPQWQLLKCREWDLVHSGYTLQENHPLYHLSGKSCLVDHSGPECSWSNTQHHSPAGAPGPPLDHLDPAWTTSCNHTLEIAVQGGSRWTSGTRGTMELGVGPGALWSHFYILLIPFIVFLL